MRFQKTNKNFFSKNAFDIPKESTTYISYIDAQKYLLFNIIQSTCYVSCRI